MNYVIANWKMKMSQTDVENWVSDFTERYKPSDVNVVVAPSFINIPYVKEKLGSLEKVFVGAQDVSADSKGSHTGEVSAFQLKDYCKYVIVGHSERAEDLALVIRKRDIVLEHGLIPVVCFTTPEQAKFFYKEGAILAWEDPTNISSGGVYSEKPLEDIEENVDRIKESLPRDAVLLYGGSVNKDNIYDLANLSKLDGVLVGHSSLDSGHFIKLIETYALS